MKKIQELLRADPERVSKLVREIGGPQGTLLADYTKTHITEEDAKAWEDKLGKLEIYKKIGEMFGGKRINYTESRQVLHTILRSPAVIRALKKETGTGRPANTPGLSPEEQEALNELLKMKRICGEYREQKMLGASKKPIKNLVGIGIGGSDLGPRLLTASLGTIRFSGPAGGRARYVSNVDAQEIERALDGLDLEETAFVIVSKTFTTQETLENAKIALARVLGAYGSSQPERTVVSSHFLAVTAAKGKAVEFGIEEANVLNMWDYVGGRYSLWSSVSLTSAMAMGFEAFTELLSGAAEMDRHFQDAPVPENIPMIHAMAECKYFNELGYNNKCIVVYDHYLRLLPSYLQQAEMESNGKSYSRSRGMLIADDFDPETSGAPDKQTGAIIWGGVGTDSQHSYFQLLHQGTARVLAEFLVPVLPHFTAPRKNTEAESGQSTAHDVLIANCLAQSRALMLGKSVGEDRHFTGNRPSITIMYSKLDPFVLGMLLAMYEHKIFVQGIVWGINSYDQFGVELGKQLAKEILLKIEKQAEGAELENALDASSSRLLGHYQKHKGGEK